MLKANRLKPVVLDLRKENKDGGYTREAFSTDLYKMYGEYGTAIRYIQPLTVGIKPYEVLYRWYGNIGSVDYISTDNQHPVFSILCLAEPPESV